MLYTSNKKENSYFFFYFVLLADFIVNKKIQIKLLSTVVKILPQIKSKLIRFGAKKFYFGYEGIYSIFRLFKNLLYT